MDTITLYKHRIDGLMDILFGAGVSNPQTIIEQLNYLLFLRALSIKDDEAELLGITDESEKIFVGDLKQYRWQNLLVLNAEDLFKTLETSFDLLQKKSKNPTVKLLFRNAHIKIFDKPTLRRVLHEIEAFSKELDSIAHEGNKDVFGDMYEYLLSKLSSAGTNGQFRTPRHIIDFMIRVVDPKKGETIMDPACGTAGFLVSAYRYIAEEYTSEKMKKAGSPRAMDKLSSDEKNFLFNHMFTGFDSDEDMIKFGMMNLHLHGLTKSRLIRQNSLTDTSGMKDKFDVILANPPFAGKIDEESVSEDIRMGTKATELLFLRFMMDHLSVKGKLAVIVPEGVIFNSSKAHSKVREMLIEKGLWAVVSLPSGVFNPYAGVKTSLLFLDQDIAKKNKEVAFIRVTNDGFDLGAQRRPITKNDLPTTLDVLNEWKSGKKIQDSLVNYVEKSKINESNDYSLSGDRYIETTDYSNTKWSMVSLGDILDYEQPTEYIVTSVDYRDEYPTPVLTAGKTFVLGYTNEKEGIFTEGLPVIIFDDFTTATKLVDFPFKVKSSAMKILRTKNEKIDIRYVFYAMQSIKFSFSEHKRFWISEYSKIKIPLPPLEVQKQIIKELDHYQKMIEGARMFTEDWTPRIEIDPSWKKVKLGEVCKIGSSKRVFESEWKDNGIPFYRAREIVKLAKNGFVDNELYISEKMFDDYSKKYGSPKEGDLMITGVGTLGICYLVNKEDKFYFKDGNIIWLRGFNDVVDSRFVKYLFEDDFVKNQIKASANGGTVGTYTITNANNTIIPLPPIETQKKLVEKINFECKVIESTKGLIPVLEQKIKDRIEKLWA